MHFSEKNINTISGAAVFFFIGLMGVGKTFWAKKLSSHFHLLFFDLDDLIENSEQKNITEIFAEKGENYFRKKEAEILRTTASYQKVIISTGGGCPCFFDNMKWMNEHGITIWIDEDLETVSERLKEEKQQRPLIKNLNADELIYFLQKKYEERKPFYSLAKHHLDKSNISKQNFIKIIEQYV